MWIEVFISTHRSIEQRDAVNAQECLLPYPLLQKLAKESGLEIEYFQNFHEFYQKRCEDETNSAARSLLREINVLNRNGSLSSDEWHICRMYCAFRCRKVRQTKPPPIPPSVKGKLLPLLWSRQRKQPVLIGKT